MDFGIICHHHALNPNLLNPISMNNRKQICKVLRRLANYIEDGFGNNIVGTITKDKGSALSLVEVNVSLTESDGRKLSEYEPSSFCDAVPEDVSAADIMDVIDCWTVCEGIENGRTPVPERWIVTVEQFKYIRDAIMLAVKEDKAGFNSGTDYYNRWVRRIIS